MRQIVQRLNTAYRMSMNRMSMISNYDLIKGFVAGTMNGRQNGSMSVSDDGKRLFSYATCIAQFDGGLVYVNIGKYSVTTSRQQSILKSCVADYVERGGDVELVDNKDRGVRYLN